MSQWCHTHVRMTLDNVTIMSHKCHNNVSQMLQWCDMQVVKVVNECYNYLLKMSQGFHINVQRMYHTIMREVNNLIVKEVLLHAKK